MARPRVSAASSTNVDGSRHQDYQGDLYVVPIAVIVVSVGEREC
jgi:hypothetical protein